MFNPLSVAGGFAAAAGKPIIDMAGTTLASWIDAVTLPLKYELNYKQLTQLPSVADGYEAYLSGNMSKVGFDELCRFSNIPTDTDKKDQFQRVGSALWSNVFAAKIPRLSMENIIYLYLSGSINKADADVLLKKYAFNKDQLAHLWQLLQPKFDITTIFAGFYRGFADKTFTLQSIRRLYGCGENDANRIITSSQFLPPPSDLLRFAVKSVYNPDEIAKLGLDKEYDEIQDAIPWMKAQGIVQNAEIMSNGAKITRDIIKDYWVSHWQLMSPTQGYSALHRLRPNRIDRYQELVPGVEPFQITELNLLLKANDYVPAQRKWLASISYNTLGRIDLRRLFNDRVIDEDELSEQYYDLGYNKPDTKMLVDWQVKERKRIEDDKKKKEQTRNYGKLIAETLAAYEEGSIGRDGAFQTLAFMYDDEQRALNDLNAIDIRVNRKRIKQFIIMVKRSMFMGQYDGLGAYTDLVTGGVDSVRANQYVIRWQRELDRPRRMVSIGVILDWMKRALITVEDAKHRLETLGLSNADTMLYLQQATQDIEKAIAIEQTKKAKSEQQRVNESQRLLDKLKAARKESQAVLRSYSPLSAMKRWLQDDRITVDQVQERMEFLDIPAEDRARYLSEWLNNGHAS